MKGIIPDPRAVAFWEAKMQPILHALGAKRYVFSEINELYQRLVFGLYGRYKCKWQNLLDDESSRDIVTTNSTVSPMSSTVIGRVPTISIFIPEWVGIFSQAGGSQETFETAFVVGYFHEMIHLARGLAPKHGQPINRQHMLYSERLVWADTCEKAIELFVRRGRTLLSTEQMYYDAWIQCGRNAESQAWEDFVEGLYQHVHFIENPQP